MTPTDQRLTQWQQAVSEELQSLVQQASTIQSNINNARTVAKRNYFKKKFSKVQTEVMRMLVAQERLNAQLSEDKNAIHCIVIPILLPIICT